MQAEHKVLAALMVSRDSFRRMDEFLDDGDFTAQGRVILRAISAYYERDRDARKVDQGILVEQIDKTLGNAKKLDTFKEVLANLPYDIGAVNVSQSVLEQKQAAAADKLANALAERSMSNAEQVSTLLEEYRHIHQVTDLSSTKSFTRYDVSVENLFGRELAADNKIKLLPKVLNDMIGGGAYPGHCVIIFGRVEMGKSMFALNLSAGCIAQNLRVLYIDNEDSLMDTQRRFVQRLIRKPKEWCLEHKEEAHSLSIEKGIDRFILTEDPGNAHEVESAILYYRPDVVVVNQMRNMVSGDGAVDKLDTLAHKLRQIGKKHRKLMVLITAAREGEVDRTGQVRDKIILERADVYSSRTGIPAAADLLIGWGGSAQMQENCQACLSVVKNKIMDTGGHGARYCTVMPEIGLIQGA